MKNAQLSKETLSARNSAMSSVRGSEKRPTKGGTLRNGA